MAAANRLAGWLAGFLALLSLCSGQLTLYQSASGSDSLPAGQLLVLRELSCALCVCLKTENQSHTRVSVKQ